MMDWREKFRSLFGREPSFKVRAPGRVNLIGEHTDYNEGFVLPMAVEFSVYYIVASRDDRLVRLHSANFNEYDEFRLDDIERGEKSWANYVRGVAKFLGEKVRLQGMEAYIEGNLPIGAGLSSSAAMEVGAILSFQAISRFEMGRKEMALICQRAENEFVGMRCGVMDQLASLLSEEGKALFIDCRSLETKGVALPQGYVIAICDSKVRRELVSSEYNERRRDCEEASEVLGVRALRDATLSILEGKREELGERIYRRAKHVVEENERVLKAVEALERGDAEKFGELMYESHQSLRYLYEVSSPELDSLVEIARSIEGVLGARLTGAGFGGCTVNLLKKGKEEEFEDILKKEYERRTGKRADVWFSSPARGGYWEEV